MLRYIALSENKSKYLRDFATRSEAEQFVEKYNETKKPYEWLIVVETEFGTENSDYLFGALACYNGDAFIIETEEAAEELFESINGTDVRLVEDEEEFEDAKRKLDLEDFKVSAIYFGGGTYFCLAQDWANE